ncbi:MAG TPA: hypothetical protein VGM81_24840 [Burkholderiaceae bacterium]|jgi:hypothetical protein
MPDTNNPYAPPEAHVADIAASVEPSPPLWNPNAAASWSLLLTPVFGAVLQMKNWQALGEPEKAETSKRWAIGCLIFMVLMSFVAAFFVESSNGISRTAGLGLLFAWYYGNGKAQNAYVLARFGKTYSRKGWALALLCGVAGLAAFLVLMMIVGIIYAALSGQL